MGTATEKRVPFCAYEFSGEPLEVVGSKLASPIVTI
jgi:hypothetical protein